uniref:G_PROTEIN_RECEP_F1_2 domain-containing protein n=1 Tax=Steinernema glaseri TaxID=37863 RepID=A0A1I7Z3A8_9BILA
MSSNLDGGVCVESALLKGADGRCFSSRESNRAWVNLKDAPREFDHTWMVPQSLENNLVFAGLECLGAMAIIGNMCLIAVFIRHKYLSRPSFVLMLSLATADVLHGVVTSTYFYPPILLQRIHVPYMAIRVFNILDWTAWSVTLTHMAAISVDRLVAITFYGRYNQIITHRLIRNFSVACWIVFLATNTTFFVFNFCCLITPLNEHHYYTFGFETYNLSARSFSHLNIYTYTYVPLEILTIAILTVSTPLTLIQLYRRHKRKMALRMASTMLIEMSMKMGSHHVQNHLKEIAARRANRQQQRIFFQISIVTVFFYSYMTAYYTCYYLFEVTNKWAVLFNSFFYSATQMINPLIYFWLNRELRQHLVESVHSLLPLQRLVNLLRLLPCRCRNSSKKDGRRPQATETSPLFSGRLTENLTAAGADMSSGVEVTTVSTSVQHCRESITALISTCNQIETTNEVPSMPSSSSTDEHASVPDEDSNKEETPSEPTEEMLRQQRASFLDALIQALWSSYDNLSREVSSVSPSTESFHISKEPTFTLLQGRIAHRRHGRNVHSWNVESRRLWLHCPLYASGLRRTSSLQDRLHQLLSGSAR